MVRRRGVAAALLALATGCALTACAAAGPGGTGGTGDTGGSPGDGPGDGAVSRVEPLIDLGCAELIDGAAIEAAYGVAVPEAALPIDGVGGLFPLAHEGLRKAGALRCAWADGAGADDHYLYVDVLPDATESWQRFEADLPLVQPRSDAWGDAAFVACQDGELGGCRMDVLVDALWIRVNAYGLVGSDAIDPVLERIIDAVTGAADAGDRATPGDTASDCAALLPLNRLNAAFGGDLAPWEDRGAFLYPAILQAGLEAAGGTICSWRNSFGSAEAHTVEVVVLPDAAQVWEDHFGRAVPERATVDPAEFGDAGYLTSLGLVGGELNGAASALVGGTWVDVTVNHEGSEDDAAIAAVLAEIVLESFA